MVQPVDRTEPPRPDEGVRDDGSFSRAFAGAPPPPEDATPTPPPEGEGSGQGQPPVATPEPTLTATATTAPFGPPPAPTPTGTVEPFGPPLAPTPTGTAEPPAREATPAGEAAQPGPGILESLAEGARRAANAYLPDSYTYGFALGPKMPVQGVVLVSAPMLPGWLPTPNDPLDFTTEDLDPANGFVANIRGGPMLLDPYLPPSADPMAPIASTVYGLEVESRNVWSGENPITRIEYGKGRIDRIDNPVLPFAVISSVRVGENLATNQTVLSGNVGLNVQALPAASLGLKAAAGIAAAIPGGQPVAAGLAHLSLRADALGATLRETVAPCFGVGWRFEARLTNPDLVAGTPMRFDGLYRRGEEVPLPGFVTASIDQELADPSVPGNFGAGLATRLATNGANAATDAAGLPRIDSWDEVATARLDAATDAVGLPRVDTWDEAVPEPVRSAAGATARVLQETLADAERPTLLSPLPIPGLSLPGSLAKNLIEEGWTAAAGEVPGWMQSLLDPWHMGETT